MANITVLGTGLVGKAIALDLAEHHQITAVDKDAKSLGALVSRNSAIQPIESDLTLAKNISDVIQSADLVVSAVPGFMGYKTLTTIIQCGKNVVDIAFCPEDTLELDALAKQHNVTAVVDMGVAPGLSNLVLGYYSTEIEVDNFKCMVGGLPKNPKPPFNYKAPFSPVDVLEEYTRPARLVRGGELITLPALSEIEQVDFEKTGTLEAFNTDGLRTLIQSFPDIPNMVEKTLRYPGHASLMQTLIDIGFLDFSRINTSDGPVSPVQVTTELLKQHWQLEEGEPEFTVMNIHLSGRNKQHNNEPVNRQYLLYDEFNTDTGIGSMARTTGYTCTAAANLILNGKIAMKGVIPPEAVGQVPGCFDEIMQHYKARDISLKQVISNNE